MALKENSKKKRPGRKSNSVVLSANERMVQFARAFFGSKEKSIVKAYISAGYSANKAAAGNASRLFKHPFVQAELKRLAKLQEKRLEIKSDEILSELLKSALSDVRELFDDNGILKEAKDWPDHIARAVSSIQIEEIKEWDFEAREHKFKGYTKKIKLWDKIKALELLGKHLKLFQDNITVKLTTDIITRMESAKQRTILDD